MTPSQYKKRYESIVVPMGDDPPITVRVNKYRLRSANYNTAVATTFLTTLAKRGIDSELRVDTEKGTTRVDPRLTAHADAVKKGKPDFVLSGQGLGRNDIRVDTRVVDWNPLARFVFAGKGSPEACQIVLQLAVNWGITTDPQAYADSALGLDCNGFVGNYIWHVKRNNPWTKLGVGNMDLGPDSPVQTGFYDRYKGRLLDRWEAMDTSLTYIMMRVGPDNIVINQGSGANIAHIVITEPGGRQDRPGKNGANPFAVKVVESTGGAPSPGLSESLYSCEKVENKIFSIDREGMLPAHRHIRFKIAAIS